MKFVWLVPAFAILLFGLSGCASTDATAKGDPVPGERTGDDAKLQPGASMPGSASVKW